MTGKIESVDGAKGFWNYQLWIVHPKSRVKFMCRVWVSLILLVQLLFFPYRYAFRNYSDLLIIFDFNLDVMLLFDFAAHFFYSHIDERQKLVTRFKPIFSKYFFGRMIFDLVSLYPYYFFEDQSMYVLKILRFLRIGDIMGGISMALDEFFLKIKNNLNFSVSITRIIK